MPQVDSLSQDVWLLADRYLPGHNTLLMDRPRMSNQQRPDPKLKADENDETVSRHSVSCDASAEIYQNAIWEQTGG